MSEQPAAPRRQRRRRRAVWRPGEGVTRTVEPARPAPPEPPPATPVPEPPPAAAPARPPAKRRRADPGERGLRELVGAGPSQLGPVRAMRARDANRPTDADLAEAEQDLVIVRRNWKPPKP